MKLELPGSSVGVAEGFFAFSWPGFGALDLAVARCTSLYTRGHGQDGGVQLVFQFRPEAAGPGASGLVMVRIDVTAPYAASAAGFVTELRDRHGIIASADDDSQEDAVRGVPNDSRHWITAPVNADSEELHKEILDRIATEPAS